MRRVPVKSMAGLALVAFTTLGVDQSIAQQFEETRLTGFVFESTVLCADEPASDCSMLSFQIYGKAAHLMFAGMKSQVSKEPDMCTDMHYKLDIESGLICFVSENLSDSLCTFGYDFNSQKITSWAGSC